MPTRFFLRVEAVNLAHFVTDTEDLSTIRGGGLMLLNSPTEVKNMLGQIGVGNVEPITAGASQCIFAFEAADSADAKSVRDKIAAGLREVLPGDPLRKLGHATFVVDVCPADKEFPRRKEELLARNRWRQMNQTRVAVPAENPHISESQWPYCGVDMVRPAIDRNSARSEDKRWVSKSVKARADYGRSQKRKFYAGWADVELPEWWAVANDFHEIAARGQHRFGSDADENPDPHSRLNDKIAIIYIDGNKFGPTGQRFATTPEKQRKWDDHIQKFRKLVLTRLLNQATAEGLAGDRWRCKVGGRTVARLETLLWGGDELIWVVPAWKGWSVVQMFFEEARKFYRSTTPTALPASPATPTKTQTLPTTRMGVIPNLNAPSRKPTSKPTAAAPAPPIFGDTPPPLTHACGLVFAHADAPIQGLIGQAHELADLAKVATKRERDAVAYRVLESFDQLVDTTSLTHHLPEDLLTADQRLDRRDRHLVIAGDELHGLLADLRTMTTRFPRGSVYRLLRAIRGRNNGDYAEWLTRAKREAGTLPDRFPPSLAPTREYPKVVNWLHLAELWDYVGEG